MSIIQSLFNNFGVQAVDGGWQLSLSWSLTLLILTCIFFVGWLKFIVFKKVLQANVQNGVNNINR